MSIRIDASVVLDGPDPLVAVKRRYGMSDDLVEDPVDRFPQQLLHFGLLDPTAG